MARKLCLPRTAIFIASVLGAYFAFDYSAYWCSERKLADSVFWPHRLWVGRAQPTVIQQVVCPRVDLLVRAYRHVCPDSVTNSTNVLARPYGGVFEQWPTPCELAKIVRGKATFWRAVPFENGLAYLAWNSGRELYTLLTDSVRRLFLADSDSTCTTDCPEGDQLDRAFRRLYTSFHGEKAFFGYTIECSCAMFEDASYRFLKHQFKVMIYGAAAMLMFIGFMICVFYSRPTKLAVVVDKCNTLARAVVTKFRALKMLHTNANLSVFLMQHRQSGVWAYVKCLRADCSRTARRRFLTELIALRAVKHQNIVRLLDWERVGSRYSIGAECAPYGGLDYIMEKRRDSYSLVEKRFIFRQLIEAVAWMHTIGWVHLNIRAGSVLVFDKWSNVKLSGFSRAMRKAGNGLCSVYNLHPTCCSPRVLKGKPYDPAGADVWALRSLFLFISTGQQVRPGLEGEAPLTMNTSAEWDNSPSYSEKLFKTMAEFFANDVHFDCKFLSVIMD